MKNKNKKNNKKIDILLIALVVILVIIAIVLIIMRIVNGKVLKSDGELVTTLHNYFSTDDLTNCGGLFNYTDGSVKSNDLDEANKMCLAYYKASLDDVTKENYDSKKKSETCDVNGMIFKVNEGSSECTVTKIPKELINDAYYKIFGENTTSKDAFNIDGFNICYLKDDYYYCGLSEVFTYTYGNDAHVYRVIKKAVEEKDKSVVIYDYFIRIIGDKCYTTYTTTINSQSCTNAYNELKDKKIEYNFLKEYGTLYKHTYKKDKDKDYHWVSTEKVEEE